MLKLAKKQLIIRVVGYWMDTRSALQAHKPIMTKKKRRFSDTIGTMINHSQSTHRSQAVRILAALALAALLFGVFIPARAQAGGRVVMGPVDASKFPVVQLNFEAYDAYGRFAASLSKADVQALEDDNPLPVQALQQQEPGLQFILALNAAPLLTAQTAGVSHFDQLRGAVAAWAETRPSNGADDYSLSTNTGLMTIRSDDPAKLVEALDEYGTGLLEAAPSSVSLSEALDLATDPNPRPQMKRALLYITPPPVQATLDSLPSMISRASQLGLRIYVWLVAPANQAGTQAVEALRPLADETGGMFYQFTGEEAPPNIEEYLEPLRFIYHAEYRSVIQSSGAHNLKVQVNSTSFQATGAEGTFEVKVLPPNPIFLSPPSQIQRVYAEMDTPQEVPSLQPSETTIHIMIEFPDGHERNLRAARLFVDGALASEVTKAPFDKLPWPLMGYQSGQSHVLKVEVEDELGLSQTSIEAPVEVTVEELEIPWWQNLIGEQRYTVALAAVLAGSILTVVLALTGKRSRRKDKRRQDPLTQQVRVRNEPRSQPRHALSGAQQVTWPRALAHPDAPARLVRLSENGHSLPSESVALSRKEVTFGCDPQMAITVLNSPSVSPLHARLYQDPEGRYILVDNNSVAGTWVNYAPVSKLGVHLEHGDLVHIGRMSYRFELRDPGANRRPIVTPYQDEDL